MMLLDKYRNSNIEVLRILAMLFIIMHHMISQGFSFSQNPEPSVNLAFLLAFNSLGNFGNKLFIIISGYFLYGSKFSVKKIVSVWLELFIYSFGISLILFIFNVQIYGVAGNGFCFTRILEKRDFRITELFFSALPFITGQNWFLTAYLIFLLFVPFLNVLVDNLDMRMHILLNVLCFFLFNAVQLIPFADVYVINNYSSFFQMFFAGSFLKKYSNMFSSRCRKIMLCTGICLPVMYYVIRFAVFNHYGYYENVPSWVFNLVITAFAYDTIFIISSFMIFAGVLGLKERLNGFINLVASTTFGVYLFHDHNYFRRNIWFDFCHLQEHFESADFIAHMILCVLAVFCVCASVDFARKILLEPGCRLVSGKVEKIVSSFAV